VTHVSTRTEVGIDTVPLGVGRMFQRSVVAYVALTGTLLAIGIVGRLVVFDSAIGDGEADVVGWVADHRIRVLDTAATIGSTLADTWTVIGVLGGATIVLLAAGHGRWAVLMLVGMGLELSAFLTVSELIGRTRPAAPALHSVPSTPSFPSGHVAASIVLYGSLTLAARRISRPGRVPRQVWVVPAVIAVTVGSSRVYEGVHFPTDAGGGALLGVGALIGATFIVRPVDQTSRAERVSTVPTDRPFVPGVPRGRA
jgi:undecaprenyl-diphosphatase